MTAVSKIETKVTRNKGLDEFSHSKEHLSFHSVFSGVKFLSVEALALYPEL